MSSPHPRVPQPVSIPAGAAGIDTLSASLHLALKDPNLVVAPLPDVSAHVTAELRTALLAAIQPNEPVGDPQTQVILTTSGSTGAPKGVMHSLEGIAHSTTALHERLGGPGHWVCALPLHTSAGFMTVARSVIAGTAATPMASLAGASQFTPSAFIAASETSFSHTGRHYVSLVPQQAARLLESGEAAAALSEYDAVLLGGQAIPADLIAELRAAGVTMTLSYGSTETCGGCVYDGRPLAGVEISADQRGITISGPQVMRGYRTSPDSIGAGTNADGSFTMPDAGEIRNGLLVIHGRSDDVIIINGVNVSPTHIESLLRELGVEGIVVADKNAQRLVAVTAQTTADEQFAEAVAAVRRHIGLPIVRMHIGELPLAASGKPDRAAIAALAADRH